MPSREQWDASHHGFARIVARSADRVVGWAALGPVSCRACYAGVAELSIYVAADHGGQGIGRLLLLADADSEQHHTAHA